MNRILKSYFYWTYPRGNVHYDILVTLILAFIFITPHLWDYGDKPSVTTMAARPIEVTGDGSHSLIITIPAADIDVPMNATDSEVRKILRKAVEPVAGDAVFVERWEIARDSSGNPAWKVWTHR